jgi:hypothetical protein
VPTGTKILQAKASRCRDEAERLAAEVTPVLRGLRWSSARECPQSSLWEIVYRLRVEGAVRVAAIVESYANARERWSASIQAVTEARKGSWPPSSGSPGP